jgi:hypothetical protein
MSDQPIFILGIAQRSGTNYLHDLLALHPDCATREPRTAEDYLLRDSDKLCEYARSLAQFWEAHWQIRGQEPAILEALGSGLRSLISAAASGKRVLTKTPCVYNIAHFPRLFPGAPLLIIVRDGRAVAESAHRSFQQPYEYSARMWAYGAKLIKSFVESQGTPAGAPHLLLRYEDVVQNVRGEMARVLDCLRLDAARYDFQAAENLPVRGSSVYRGARRDLHWDPVPKTEAFNPLNRFEHWSRAMHSRFNWMAGEELKYFGYSPDLGQGGRIDRVLNRCREVRYALAWRADEIWHRIAGGWETLFRSPRRLPGIAAEKAAISRGAD